MKYKLEINNGCQSVYASILDENDNWICHMNFNKQHIQGLGNRYDKDGMADASYDLDSILDQVLYKIQEELGLAVTSSLLKEE